MDTITVRTLFDTIIQHIADKLPSNLKSLLQIIGIDPILAINTLKTGMVKNVLSLTFSIPIYLKENGVISLEKSWRTSQFTFEIKIDRGETFSFVTGEEYSISKDMTSISYVLFNFIRENLVTLVANPPDTPNPEFNRRIQLGFSFLKALQSANLEKKYALKKVVKDNIESYTGDFFVKILIKLALGYNTKDMIEETVFKCWKNLDKNSKELLAKAEEKDKTFTEFLRVLYSVPHSRPIVRLIQFAFGIFNTSTPNDFILDFVEELQKKFSFDEYIRKIPFSLNKPGTEALQKKCLEFLMTPEEIKAIELQKEAEEAREEELLRQHAICEAKEVIKKQNAEKKRQQDANEEKIREQKKELQDAINKANEKEFMDYFYKVLTSEEKPNHGFITALKMWFWWKEMIGKDLETTYPEHAEMSLALNKTADQIINEMFCEFLDFFKDRIEDQESVKRKFHCVIAHYVTLHLDGDHTMTMRDRLDFHIKSAQDILNILGKKCATLHTIGHCKEKILCLHCFELRPIENVIIGNKDHEIIGKMSLKLFSHLKGCGMHATYGMKGNLTDKNIMKMRKSLLTTRALIASIINFSSGSAAGAGTSGSLAGAGIEFY